jgi:hypothetical protein
MWKNAMSEKNGMPELTGVIPAPDLNTKSEEERLEKFDKVCEQLLLKGYFIKSKWRIRNKAFDKPGQKTTLKIVYRPCKTEDEMKIVFKKAMAILTRLADERDEECRQRFLVDNPEFLEMD